MYYHVRIDYYNDKLKGIKTLYEYDYTDIETIVSNVVIKYLSNERILFDGAVLAPGTIELVHVYSTENNIDSTKEIANSHNNYVVYSQSDILKSREYSKDITREVMNKAKEQLNNNNPLKNSFAKKPMVFISHSSKDYDFVEALTDMLQHIGLTHENLFCSSIPGLWIGLSQDIFESLRQLFQEYDLYVIFVQSHRYYESAASLNEMGAAWVLQTKFCSILTKDMNYDDMKGVFDKNKIAIKVNDNDAPYRLTELKNDIFKFLHLDPIDETRWERERTKFLKQVKEIL
jgi:hypothetical protein